MRAIFLGVCTSLCLAAAPVLAATVSATTSFSVHTTDWVQGIIPDRTRPNVSILYGSELFEADHIYANPATSDRLRIPGFDTGGAPFDWVHVSHDLTMRVATTGRTASSGGFRVMLRRDGPPIASGSYNRTDFVASSGRIRSTGTPALSPYQFAGLNSRSFNVFFHIRGGAGTTRSFAQPYATVNDDYPDFDFLTLSRPDGNLYGSITVTSRIRRRA